MNNPLPQVPSSPRRSALLARLSLEHKLPLLIGALLLSVIIVLSTAAYMEVKRISMRTSSERLTSVTNQFRDLFQQSAVQLRGQVIATAKKPDVAGFAASRDPRARERARAALSYTGPQTEQVLAVELRDSAGATILSTAKPGHAMDSMSTRELLAHAPRGDSAAIGMFRLLRDTIVYPIAARIPGSSSYVVQWRRVSGSRRGREQLNQLVGSAASIFLGNADGSVWTDLERSVPTPVGPGDVRQAAPIARTPWVVIVNFPAAAIMAPANAFLGRMALIAAVALAVALFAAWLLSRRITEPLSQLTDAADAIATGRQSREVHIGRSDELGRLGQAFTTMASEVEQARQGLERQVHDRTRELQATLKQLSDAQDTLVRREKLALLGQLSSGVGHELRNPLGVMTNAIYFLKMVLAESPQNVKEYLDIIQQQITLSEKIVSDLLDFARQKPPQRRAASVDTVTKRQIAALGPTNGVRIVNDIPSRLPAVLVDETQIGQIVLNLLVNAMQAMNGTGVITVRADASENHVQYEVTDTGPGIPRENLEKVFEPLFTTKARGIGLGLAVSRTLARANEGDLTVTNTPGAGATFRLWLPIADKEAA